MSTGNPLVLSVDDDQSNQRLIQGALEEKYELRFAGDGESALNEVRQATPDIILLDVNLPQSNGFEICGALRSKYSAEELPILFVSALDSLDKKLEGYEVGGNDYITKPISLPLLLSKIAVLLKQKSSMSKLKFSLDTRKKAMFSTMEENSELGIVMRFMENSFGCVTLEDLAKACFESCNALGLSSSIQFRSIEGIQSFSSTGAIQPLEEQLLTAAANGNRIISLNQKALFNCPELSILVRNMPTTKEEYCGRLRDHLAIMIKAAQTQHEIIESRQAQKNSRNEMIQNTSDLISDDITFLQEQFIDFCLSLESCYEDFRVDFQETAAIAGLNSDQEATLLESMDRLLDGISRFSSQKKMVNQKIAEITAALMSTLDT